MIAVTFADCRLQAEFAAVDYTAVDYHKILINPVLLRIAIIMNTMV